MGTTFHFVAISQGVFVALHLTQGCVRLKRFPISFQSREKDGTMRLHLVLGIFLDGVYGAFGISREPRLMNKSLSFLSLEALIEDYVHAYNDVGHTVEFVTVGRTISHNAYARPNVCWQYFRIDVGSAEQV